MSLNHETKKVLVPVPIEPKDTDKVVDKSTGISKVENMTPMVTPEMPKQTEPNVPDSTLPMQPELPKETGKPGNNVETESPKPIENSTDDSANKPDSTTPKTTDNIIIPNPTLPMKPDSTEETENQEIMLNQNHLRLSKTQPMIQQINQTQQFRKQRTILLFQIPLFQ